MAAVRSRGFTLDDGAIDTRYVRQLVAGHGWLWNLGEHVNGVTSPLYVLVCTAVALVLRSASTAQHVVSALASWAAGVAVWRLLRGPGAQGGVSRSRPWAVVAGLTLPALPSLTHTGGLETPLYLAFLFGVPQLRGWPRWFAAGLAPLVRPDAGLLTLLVVGLALVEPAHRPRIRWVLAGAVAPVCWLAYSVATFHELIPTTVTVKAEQGRGATGGFAYTAGWRRELLSWCGGSAPLLWCALAVACAGLALAVRCRAWLLVQVAVVISVQQAVFALVPVPAYRWYYTPLVALIATLCFHALGELCAADRVPRVGGAALATVAGAALLGSYLPEVPHGNDARERTYQDIAAQLSLRAGASSVVCSEIGTLGADLPLSWRVVDLSGLTTAPVLTEPAERHRFWDVPSAYVVLHWFQDRLPDAAATQVMRGYAPALGPGAPFPSESPFLTDPRFRARYRLVAVDHRSPYAPLLVFLAKGLPVG